jgi:hypothetical protein
LKCHDHYEELTQWVAGEHASPVVALTKRSRSTSSDSSFFEIVDIPIDNADPHSLTGSPGIKPPHVADSDNDVSSEDEDEKELIRAFLEVSAFPRCGFTRSEYGSYNSRSIRRRKGKERKLD